MLALPVDGEAQMTGLSNGPFLVFTLFLKGIKTRARLL